jgi:peroxiredoxin
MTMISLRTSLTMLFLFATMAHAGVQGLNVGDKAIDFSLKNIDGKMVSLSDYEDARGYIVVFTCNTCPYARAYESRIIKLSEKYAPQGYPVIAINPNDPGVQPKDSFDAMKDRAAEKNFNFPYLVDENQHIAKTYGALRTPQVFILKKDLTVAYIGAIDNNYKSDDDANTKYVEDALQAMMKGQPVEVTQTKAVGCGIKWKKS